MEIILYLQNENNHKIGSRDWHKMKEFKRFEIDDSIKLTENPIKINNKYYTWSSCCIKHKHFIIKEIESFDMENDTANYNSNLICPVCGYENLDSFELDEQDSNYRCENCFSVLSYEREITVTYNADLVIRSEPIILKEED